MKKSTYDVIIPVKDMAVFLPEAVRSVFALQPPPEKLIIVDDGSSDHPQAAVTPDERIVWIVHEQSQGKSRSRNEAIRACSGDFIQFLDADDFLSVDKVARQLQYFAENPDTDAVVGDVVLFEDGTHPDSGTLREYGENPDILLQLIRKNTFAIHAFLWRRDFFEQFGWFDPYFEISQDRELYIRSILAGASIRYQPGPKVYYRRHPGSSIKSRQFDAAHFNAEALARHAGALATFAEGKYCVEVASSLRMLARNANIHGRPWREVTDRIKTAYSLDEKLEIAQNSVYKSIEKIFGPYALEAILRPKFAIDRRVKTFE